MFDLPHLIQSVSYLGIFGMIFTESGLLAGFFLPGDSLLITAGILARSGSLNLPGVMLAVFLGESSATAWATRLEGALAPPC